MRSILVCLAVVAIYGSAYAKEPYVFKGNTFGTIQADESVESSRCRKYTDDPSTDYSNYNEPKGYTVCKYRNERIGDIIVDTLEYHYLDNRLFKVEIERGTSYPRIDFIKNYNSNELVDQLELALGAKFGKILQEAQFKTEPGFSGNLKYKGKKYPMVVSKNVYIGNNDLDVKLRRDFDPSRLSVTVHLTDRAMEKEYIQRKNQFKAAKANLEKQKSSNSLKKAVSDL